MFLLHCYACEVAKILEHVHQQIQIKLSHINQKLVYTACMSAYAFWHIHVSFQLYCLISLMSTTMYLKFPLSLAYDDFQVLIMSSLVTDAGLQCAWRLVKNITSCRFNKLFVLFSHAGCAGPSVHGRETAFRLS